MMNQVEELEFWKKVASASDADDAKYLRKNIFKIIYYSFFGHGTFLGRLISRRTTT